MRSEAIGAGADAAAAFDRLNQASIALLDPLFEPHADVDSESTGSALGDAIMRCAQVADSLGLRSLNYLAALMVPYLQRACGEDRWGTARERIEGWIGQVIALCAGHSSATEAELLVHELQRWPDFPAVPEQFVSLIAARLRQDCAVIGEMTLAAAQAGAASTPVPEPQPSVESVTGTPVTRAQQARSAPESASPEPDAPESAELESGPPDAAHATVARDELEMLLEAVEGLEAEVIAPLAGIGLPPPLDAHEAVSELTDLCRERFGNLAGAMRYVGLAPAAQLLEPCRESLLGWRDAPASAGPDTLALLHALACALSAFLRDPAEATLAALEAAGTDPRWPARSAGAVAGELAALRGLEVVGSRQVAARAGELEIRDLSLALPEDADASVVDHLLRELPALSTEFSAQIDLLLAREVTAQGIDEKQVDALAAARRIAHTLKGAANTVGISGIAVLTHRLEDLLQLLGERAGPPDPACQAALVEAADCLSEMTDAVVGMGVGPEDALGVCGALDVLIHGLVSNEAPAHVGETGNGRSGGTQEVFVSVPAPAPAVDGSVSVPDEAPAPEGGQLRVPAALLDRVLDLAGEAGILLARVQEQVEQLGEVRQAFRTDSDRLRDLASELERLVDIRGVSLSGRRSRSDFDPLELDDFNELHTVSRRIGEAGADARVLDQQLDRQGASLAEAVGQLERVQTDLREAVMQSRMVPVRSVLPRLQRVVRQASRMTGKTVELTVAGEDTAVDARLLQALIEPLGHLLRNAIDHGVEAADARARAGKAASGRVTVEFRRDGRRLYVRCSDDGRGLDLDAIRVRAVDAGLIMPEAACEPAALARLVLEPGFSTRRQATQISGRGIGLDVVQRAVRELRGGIELGSVDGGGLEVRIEVPEGIVAIPAVVVRTPSHVLALSIRGVERILPADGAARDDAGILHFVGAHGLVPALRLDELIGLPEGFFEREARAARLSGRQRAAVAREPTGAEVALLVHGAHGQTVAVLSPPPGQTRNVVVRPLPSWLPAITAVEGATVLGDGAVATVLDLPALVVPGSALAASRLPDQPLPRLPVCLVADDSVSVRRSMELFLADLGFAVDAAGDGVDALALAANRVPVLAILDLEMPRMNGVELCRALRSDPRTRDVPVIMITSRSSERHRTLAMDAGVDVFLTKPYTEDELAAQIRRCLVGRTGVG